MSTVIARYVIELNNGTESGEFEYEILDSYVSRVWKLLVTEHINDGSYTIPVKSQWFKDIYPNTVETRKRYWEELTQLVIELNQVVDFINLPVPFAFDDIDANNPPNTLLNFLHYEFHRLEEEGLKHPILGRLNMLIHETEELFTESKLNNPTLQTRSGFYLQTPAFPNYIDFDTNVPENASHWDYVPGYGDLTLGYHTVGKNIYHCCVNDDVALVKNRMVRPQKNISTETVLTFNQHGAATKEMVMNKMKTRVTNWVLANNLESYIDMSQPENNLYGQPLIGRLVGNYTQDDVLKILQIKNFSRVRLFETN